MLQRPEQSNLDGFWNRVLTFLGLRPNARLQPAVAPARFSSSPMEQLTLELRATNRGYATPNPQAPQKIAVAEEPKILVFEDFWLHQEKWEEAEVEQNIKNMHRFKSWEEFLAMPIPKDELIGAVAFVDHDYSDVESDFDGLDIAPKLRALGVAKIYSTTSLRDYISGKEQLFDAWLGKKIPKNLSAFVKKKHRTFHPLGDDDDF